MKYYFFVILQSIMEQKNNAKTYIFIQDGDYFQLKRVYNTHDPTEIFNTIFDNPEEVEALFEIALAYDGTILGVDCSLPLPASDDDEESENEEEPDEKYEEEPETGFEPFVTHFRKKGVRAFFDAMERSDDFHVVRNDEMDKLLKAMVRRNVIEDPDNVLCMKKRRVKKGKRTK